MIGKMAREPNPICDPILADKFQKTRESLAGWVSEPGWEGARTIMDYRSRVRLIGNRISVGG